MELSTSTIINICLGMLCIAVMVQCIRLDSALKGLKNGAMGKNVAALDGATDRARAVLTELKHALSTDGVACATAVSQAKEVSDELSLMVKIGGSMADRLVQAAEAAPKAAEKPAAKRTTPAKSSTTKSKTSTTRKKAPAKKTAAKKPAAKKPAATRKKAATKRADATAKDIKVAPAPGTRTLRLVGKDETLGSQVKAA